MFITCNLLALMVYNGLVGKAILMENDLKIHIDNQFNPYNIIYGADVFPTRSFDDSNRVKNIAF